MQQLVALGRYSHESLKSLVGADRHRVPAPRARHPALLLDPAGLRRRRRLGAEVMRRYGVDRRVLSREEVLRGRAGAGRSAPQHRRRHLHAERRVGRRARLHPGTGARAARSAARSFLFGHDVAGLRAARRAQGRGARGRPRDRLGPHPDRRRTSWSRLGAFTAPLLRPLGVRLDIYPAKGYSATLRAEAPERASTVSMIDDARKIAISRLGGPRAHRRHRRDGRLRQRPRQPDRARALRRAGAALRGAVPRRGRHHRAATSGPGCGRARRATCPTSGARRASATCG